MDRLHQRAVTVTAYPMPHGGEVACIKHLRLPAVNPQARWTQFTASLVVRGEGTYHDDQGQVHHLGPGSIFQHLPGRWHRIHRKRSDNWMEYALRFNRVTTEHFAQLGILSDQQVVNNPPQRTASIESFEQCCELLAHTQTSPLKAVHAVHTLLLTWFGVTPDQNQHDQSPLSQAARRLAADVTASWSLTEAAEFCGLSEVQFRRRFLAIHGKSPGIWREQHRLQHAAHLLMDDGLSVGVTAEACGYLDSSTFSRAFKRCYGTSPRSYQQRSNE